MINGFAHKAQCSERGSFLLFDSVREVRQEEYLDNIYSCREALHDDWEDISYDYIAIGFNNADRDDLARVAAFLLAVEKKLGIKPSTPIKTDSRNWIAFKLNNWWNKDRLRQEALTLLLRAGRSYDKSLIGCIRGRYPSNVEAFSAFLDGYNTAQEPADGFGGQFLDTLKNRSRRELTANYMRKE